MRKVLVIVGAILFSLALVFAQSQQNGNQTKGQDSENASARDKDDHDDSGPIQVGYAVVTPTSFSSNGSSTMVVFETFGLRGGGQNATQAGVVPPDLTTNSLVFVDSEGALSKNVGVAIVNPNASSENVTLTLRDNTGKTLGSAIIPVLSHQQVSKFETELFSSQSAVPKDVTGTLTITATDPVSVIGLRFRGANFSTLPVTNLSNTGTLPAIATGVGGTGAVLLPQFAAGGGWATEVVIANDGTASMTVRVDLFTKDGKPLSAALNNQTSSSFTNINIPAGGVYILAPRNSRGDDDF
jgi:hypothetical protein